jgi:hypothetical protein
LITSSVWQRPRLVRKTVPPQRERERVSTACLHLVEVRFITRRVLRNSSL